MVFASTSKVVLGCVSFGICWVLAVFPSVPFMPVGRTAGSLLGAMLMVLFRVSTPEDAYAAIIGLLLFGTMVVSNFLERADMFKFPEGNLLRYWKSRGSKDLLFRVCIISAIASALFTDDTCCVVLTEFMLEVARQNSNLPPPQPFLVIAVESFGQFLFGVFPAMILSSFWKYLYVEPTDQQERGNATGLEVSEPIVRSASVNANANGGGDHRSRSVNSGMKLSIKSLGSSSMSHEMVVEVLLDGAGARAASSRKFTRTASQQRSAIIEDAPLPSSPDAASGGEKDKELPPEVVEKRGRVLVWKTAVYRTTLGMLIALLMGLNMSRTSITALYFTDAQACLQKVSYSLLIFFCGMFITVDGFKTTGIPNTMWELVEAYSRIDSARGVALISSLASNVPTVLLLGISFGQFLLGVFPAMIVGVLTNAATFLCQFLLGVFPAMIVGVLTTAATFLCYLLKHLSVKSLRRAMAIKAILFLWILPLILLGSVRRVGSVDDPPPNLQVGFRLTEDTTEAFEAAFQLEISKLVGASNAGGHYVLPQEPYGDDRKRLPPVQWISVELIGIPFGQMENRGTLYLRGDTLYIMAFANGAGDVYYMGDSDVLADGTGKYIGFTEDYRTLLGLGKDEKVAEAFSNLNIGRAAATWAVMTLYAYYPTSTKVAEVKRALAIFALIISESQRITSIRDSCRNTWLTDGYVPLDRTLTIQRWAGPVLCFMGPWANSKRWGYLVYNIV